MAAVITPSSAPCPGETRCPSRPALRVLPGGSEAALRRRQPPAVYRRRRFGAGLALVVLVVLGGLAAAGVRDLLAGPSTGLVSGSVAAEASGSGASRLPGGASPGRAGQAVGRVHVVAPGDTLWSIAARLDPVGDPRPLVDALAERAGGPRLRVGQRIPLDGLVE